MTTAAIEAFKAKWLGSEASEKGNSQLFLTELTDLMGVPHPSAAKNDPKADHYVFERKVVLPHVQGESVGWIDLYKQGCFVLESKQGANESKGGFAKRDTPSWENEMEKARGQALGYAKTLLDPPPFLIVCDVGHVFEIHACFDGSAHWTAFPDPPKNRVFLKTLDEEKLALLRKIWTEPLSLDPSRHQAQVSRDVAEDLALLARSLEEAGHAPEIVARFLMRCIFTMFAEDIGLFPGRKKLFQEYLERFWIKNPPSFAPGAQTFWSTMNTGGHLVTGDAILRFNGGLFADPTALPLDAFALEVMLRAAKHDWSQVEPAIFGTLLERALDPKERHRLGAHYTPRAYVERLVRPTIEEPLRGDWLVVQAEARRLREAGKVREAAKALQAFHKKLCQQRVLDPACGSGNFLYVALDLLKRLESEVREELWRLGDQNELLEFDGITVRPAQFLGIEKKRWAKEIAELVLWIGYLRWHFRAKGDRGEVQAPEPVLDRTENVECRDAVLTWDGEPHAEPVKDNSGKYVTRWDGETTKPDPVTGREVPDESAKVLVYAYPNARKAGWPTADFIVGNPPFVGTKRMRFFLGDGYVDALRSSYDQIEDNADYVMHWWDRAAQEVLSGRTRRFGLITTNSVTQVFNRRVLAHNIDQGLRLLWAVPDHPWVDEQGSAAVRIAMTVAGKPNGTPRLATVVNEVEGTDGVAEVEVAERTAAEIHPDLSAGAALGSAMALRANDGLCSNGAALHGAGFILTPEEAREMRLQSAKPEVIRPYIGGRDLVQRARERWIIDFSGLSEEEARVASVAAFQRVLTQVKPERDLNRRDSIRKLWWRFGWERPLLRNALRGLKRYIATTETASHRVFQFVDATVLADHMVLVFAIDDALLLGGLSSRIHVAWALATGARLGVGNDPRYTKTRCFDPFPFPSMTKEQKERIRDLAEQLDAHRKHQLDAHPKLTITGIYNVLEKLRAGEPLSDKERAIHEDGLVSVLRQLHDELDAAVFDAYGWPTTLTDEEILERLVALNAERAEEERHGKIRWLRPDFQAPAAAPEPTQVEVPGLTPSRPPVAAPAKPGKWPKAFPERAALIRDAVSSAPADATFGPAELAARFKRAKPEDVEVILETFAALGVLVAFTDASGARRWTRPSRAA
ncbi:MAG: class I SAM-dependent DNA methyltransferase [Sandaracinaceae bacterium]|nr:class I SAM-dependent DNA methyltransferase [Sandaracinaceae bacterium]